MHEEALTKESADLLLSFGRLENFYLVGGTALALQIGHRLSLEIALMKAFSIGKRLSYKDYVDWYFLLTDKLVSLSEVIEGAKKKFGADFNDRLFLGQLVSMEDIPPQKIDFLKAQVSKEMVEQALKIAVKEFSEK